MKVTLKSITDGRRTAVLAHAAIEIEFDEFNAVIIEDLRILRNKHGELVVYPPTYSVSHGGKDYNYFPTVTFSTTLRRQIEDLILEGYRTKSGTVKRGGFLG